MDGFLTALKFGISFLQVCVCFFLASSADVDVFCLDFINRLGRIRLIVRLLLFLFPFLGYALSTFSACDA